MDEVFERTTILTSQLSINDVFFFKFETWSDFRTFDTFRSDHSKLTLKLTNLKSLKSDKK